MVHLDANGMLVMYWSDNNVYEMSDNAKDADLMIDEQFGQALGQLEGGPHHVQDDGYGGRDWWRFL